MNIVAGMILLCSMRIHEPNGFLKDVETKVWFIKPNGDAFIEHNLKKNESFRDLSRGPIYDIKNVDNLKDVRYMNCKERK